MYIKLRIYEKDFLRSTFYSFIRWNRLKRRKQTGVFVEFTNIQPSAGLCANILTELGYRLPVGLFMKEFTKFQMLHGSLSKVKETFMTFRRQIYSNARVLHIIYYIFSFVVILFLCWKVRIYIPGWHETMLLEILSVLTR